jgi:hypothetical protein
MPGPLPRDFRAGEHASSKSVSFRNHLSGRPIGAEFHLERISCRFAGAGFEVGEQWGPTIGERTPAGFSSGKYTAVGTFPEQQNCGLIFSRRPALSSVSIV